MVQYRAPSRLSGPRAARLIVLLVACTLFCGAFACTGKKRTISAIQREYAKGKYQDAIVLCERALRNNAGDGDVYYFYGLSLLALGRDAESFIRLEKAARIDSTLAGTISAELAAKARQSAERGNTAKAAGRARAAVEVDPGADVGSLRFLVADSYYAEKDWNKAVRHYGEALAEFPDTSAAERGYFNLAGCYAALGDSAAAIDALEKQLGVFPRGALASRAAYDLDNMVFDRARSEFQRGNYDACIELLRRIPDRPENSALIQRARFLLGESFERKGDFEKAYEQYVAIVEQDQGTSGGIVERARAKIRALRSAGLR